MKPLSCYEIPIEHTDDYKHYKQHHNEITPELYIERGLKTQAEYNYDMIVYDAMCEAAFYTCDMLINYILRYGRGFLIPSDVRAAVYRCVHSLPEYTCDKLNVKEK